MRIKTSISELLKFVESGYEGDPDIKCEFGEKFWDAWNGKISKSIYDW